MDVIRKLESIGYLGTVLERSLVVDKSLMHLAT